MAYSKLTTGNDAFAEMMNEFGIVTVMNARVYDIDETCKFEDNSADAIRDYYKKSNRSF